VGGPQPRARMHDDLAAPSVAAGKANVHPLLGCFAKLHQPVPFDDPLHGHNRIGAVGNRAARGDGRSRPRWERPRRRMSRRNPQHDGKRPRSLSSADGKAVHGRARKRRKISGRDRRLGEDATCGSLRRNSFGWEHLRVLEDASARFVDRQQVPHGPTVARDDTGVAGLYARVVISIVVPLFNEEESIEALFGEIAAVLDLAERPYEIVFVDDGSTDGSYAALTRLHESSDNVKVVRLRRNFGKAAALQAGFLHASGDFVVTIDADLQDDPAEIPALLAKLDEGFDLVSGWKRNRRDPLMRRLLSRVFNRVTAVVSGVRLHDVNCGLKAYRAEVVHGIRLYGELHRFIPVLASYQGYRITELPVSHRPRPHGSSRYGLERYLRGFLDLLTVSFMGRYRHRPLHLFGGLGLVLGMAGVVILVYLTILKLSGQGIGERPLLTLGVLLVVVGMQFVSLGLLSELITSQHEERAGDVARLESLVEQVLD
jgi:glycosyltransferase involved in cell wall biosynthesis